MPKDENDAPGGHLQTVVRLVETDERAGTDRDALPRHGWTYDFLAGTRAQTSYTRAAAVSHRRGRHHRLLSVVNRKRSVRPRRTSIRSGQIESGLAEFERSPFRDLVDVQTVPVAGFAELDFDLQFLLIAARELDFHFDGVAVGKRNLPLVGRDR